MSSTEDNQAHGEQRTRSGAASQFGAAHGWVRLIVAAPRDVPQHIAVCPECGGRLWWEFTTTDWLRDLHLECINEPDIDSEEDDFHRFYQSDWQPVIDKVRRWVGSGMSAPNDKVSDGGPLTHESEQDANPPFAAPLG